MKIVVAPNSFKNSLNALQVAQAIDRGLKKSKLKPDTQLIPIADGGDYTLEVLIDYFQGEYRDVVVEDPLQRPVKARYGLLNQGKTAVIEYTKASGLYLLIPDEYNPMLASSHGTGQIMKKCIEEGAEEIWLGVGGSATVEAGVGLLQALGIAFLDKNDQPIVRGAIGVASIEKIDTSTCSEKIRKTPVKILSDVENYLLGEKGAARVFGPQKGADALMVEDLEKILIHYANLVNTSTGKDITGIPGGGAAGGVPASLSAFLNTEIVSGAGFLLKQMGFGNAIEDAQVLITAEGKIDEQTLSGKGPAIVAQWAKESGLAVIGLGGSIPTHPDSEIFDVLLAIGNQPQSLEEALKLTAENLERTSCMVGNLLAVKR
jgi:glycerate kinase